LERKLEEEKTKLERKLKQEKDKEETIEQSMQQQIQTEQPPIDNLIDLTMEDLVIPK
jgi:hypothetical protein